MKPDYIVYVRLGNVYYYGKKDYNKAIESYLYSIKLNSDYFGGYWGLGNVYYFGKEDYDKAIENYLHTLKLKPDNANAYRVLSLTYNKMGNQKKYLEYLRKATQFENNNTKIN